MKVFILEKVDALTKNWHPEGGLVVVARDIEHAKELVKNEGELSEPTDEEWGRAIEYDLAPVPSGGYFAKLFVFPDAGCC